MEMLAVANETDPFQAPQELLEVLKRMLTSLRLFSLDKSPEQLLSSARTPWGTLEEKNTCAVLYIGLYLKSSINALMLVSDADMK